jgi:hypothetical protein
VNWSCTRKAENTRRKKFNMYMTDTHEQFYDANLVAAFGTATSVPVEKKVLSARSRCGRKRFGHYPGEKDVINRMLQLRAQGSGFDRIAHHLNTEGAQSRSGKPWHGRVVNRILKAEPAVRAPGLALTLGPEGGR